MQKLQMLSARLRDWWASRTAKERSNITKTVTVICAMLVLYGFYHMRGSKDDGADRVRAAQPESIVPENYLDRDIDARIESAVARILARHEQNQIAESEPVTPEPIDDLGLLDGEAIEPNHYNDLDNLNFGTPFTQFPAPPATTVEAPVTLEPEAPMYIGGINNQTVYNATPQEPKQERKQRFPIPPGFMPAKMLVGVHAQVSSAGSGSPKPIHLRVQAPATLPNNIKLQLEGCFVIANTWGNLASERIEAETVSITCMTSDRRVLIEGEMRGYMADVDGQRDVSGRVVTKAGALMGRQMVAETIGGFGDAISMTAGQTALSPLGSVQSFDTDAVLQRGVGGGVGGGLKKMGDYIGALLEQSGPIIESGAARDVMIMVQETAWLTIRYLDEEQ